MTPGLAVFLIVFFTNAAALLIDVFLSRGKNITITYYCQTHHWAAWTLLGWQVVGTIGLLFHFLPTTLYLHATP